MSFRRNHKPITLRGVKKDLTAIGLRTTSYFGKAGKGFDHLYLAVPARGGQSAEVRICTVQD
jgi:hypothetical protein